MEGEKRQKQIVAEGLETGYADRGRRFVRLHHPTAGIIAVLTHTHTHAHKTMIPLYSTSVKWLSEADGSPVLLSC